MSKLLKLASRIKMLLVFLLLFILIVLTAVSTSFANEVEEYVMTQNDLYYMPSLDDYTYNCYSFALGIEDRCLSSGGLSLDKGFTYATPETTKILSDLSRIGAIDAQVINTGYDNSGIISAVNNLKQNETILLYTVPIFGEANMWHVLKCVVDENGSKIWLHKNGPLSAVMKLRKNPWEYGGAGISAEFINLLGKNENNKRFDNSYLYYAPLYYIKYTRSYVLSGVDTTDSTYGYALRWIRTYAALNPPEFSYQMKVNDVLKRKNGNTIIDFQSPDRSAINGPASTSMKNVIAAELPLMSYPIVNKDTSPAFGLNADEAMIAVRYISARIQYYKGKAYIDAYGKLNLDDLIGNTITETVTYYMCMIGSGTSGPSNNRPWYYAYKGKMIALGYDTVNGNKVYRTPEDITLNNWTINRWLPYHESKSFSICAEGEIIYLSFKYPPATDPSKPPVTAWNDEQYM